MYPQAYLWNHKDMACCEKIGFPFRETKGWAELCVNYCKLYLFHTDMVVNILDVVLWKQRVGQKHV